MVPILPTYVEIEIDNKIATIIYNAVDLNVSTIHKATVNNN